MFRRATTVWTACSRSFTARADRSGSAAPAWMREASTMGI
jgi:hypothetical protein